MASTGDMIRRMDYMKRASRALGVKTSTPSTPILECSPLFRSANERHDDNLCSAVRKVEAAEKQVAGEHDKRLRKVKRFHNSVHSCLSNLRDISDSGLLTPGDARSRDQEKTSHHQEKTSHHQEKTSHHQEKTSHHQEKTIHHQEKTSHDHEKTSQMHPDLNRRGSCPVFLTPSKTPSITQALSEARRHSTQSDGRSFRKLRDALTVGSKAKVRPEPLSKKTDAKSGL